jgi:hypothetical protein
MCKHKVLIFTQEVISRERNGCRKILDGEAEGNEMGNGRKS